MALALVPAQIIRPSAPTITAAHRERFAGGMSAAMKSAPAFEAMAAIRLALFQSQRKSV
jgi:hypothetical protein